MKLFAFLVWLVVYCLSLSYFIDVLTTTHDWYLRTILAMVVVWSLLAAYRSGMRLL